MPSRSPREGTVLGTYSFGQELCRDDKAMNPQEGIFYYHVVNPAGNSSTGQKITGWIDCYFLKPNNAQECGR